MLLKPPVTPVTVPVLAALIDHVFTTLSPVSVLVPAPPLIAPDSVPRASVKLSLSVPPVRFSTFENVSVLPLTSMPELAPLTVNALLAPLRPIRVSVPAPPSSVAVTAGAPLKSNVSAPPPPVIVVPVDAIDCVVEKLAPALVVPKLIASEPPRLIGWLTVALVPALMITLPVLVPFPRAALTATGPFVALNVKLSVDPLRLGTAASNVKPPAPVEVIAIGFAEASVFRPAA